MKLIRNQKQGTKVALGSVSNRKQGRKVALGTVRNRKQDREEIQVTNKNNLARLGTVPNAEKEEKNERKSPICLG